MAKVHLAMCDLGPRWVFYPPQATCPKHAEAPAEILAGRRGWLSRYRSEPDEA